MWADLQKVHWHVWKRVDVNKKLEDLTPMIKFYWVIYALWNRAEVDKVVVNWTKMIFGIVWRPDPIILQFRSLANGNTFLQTTDREPSLSYILNNPTPSEFINSFNSDIRNFYDAIAKQIIIDFPTWVSASLNKVTDIAKSDLHDLTRDKLKTVIT